MVRSLSPWYLERQEAGDTSSKYAPASLAAALPYESHSTFKIKFKKEVNECTSE